MNKSIKLNTLKIIQIIIYSIIYAVGLQMFMQPANLLTTGIAGIAQIITHTLPITYGVAYLLINIPGIILGLKYLGKKFTFYSILNIIIVSIFSNLIPLTNISDDKLLNAIFGGILIGYSISKLLKIGASSGGTDFYSMYLLKQKNKDFVRMNLVINMSVLLVGIIFFCFKFGIEQGMNLGLYTIVSLYIRNSIIGQVFTNNHKLTLFIIGDKVEEVSNYINNCLHRGTTIINNVEGGYTHKKKTMIMTTLNQYEYTMFLEYLPQIKEKIFINIMDTHSIVGNYKITKKENETK